MLFSSYSDDNQKKALQKQRATTTTTFLAVPAQLPDVDCNLSKNGIALLSRRSTSVANNGQSEDFCFTRSSLPRDVSFTDTSPKISRTDNTNINQAFESDYLSTLCRSSQSKRRGLSLSSISAIMEMTIDDKCGLPGDDVPLPGCTAGSHAS